MRARSAALACAFVMVLSTHAEAQLVVPYGSCGWEYANPTGSEDRAAISQGDNGGSVWRSPICAPFVKPWGCDTVGVTFYDNINPGYGTFVFRRHIVNGLGHAVTAYLTTISRGNIDAWSNGAEVLNAFIPNECPVLTSGPAQFVLQPGDNILALFHAAAPAAQGVSPSASIGGELDAQVTATEAVTPTRGTTWGLLKVIYR